MTTRSQVAATNVACLLRARTPLIWIVTREEARVEEYLVEAAKAAVYVPKFWDTAQGLTDLAGRKTDIQGMDDASAILRFIDQAAEAGRQRGVWILRDLAPWLEPQAGGMTTLRQLKNLTRKLPLLKLDASQAIIVLATSATLPAGLAATVIEWPLPDRTEIGELLDATLAIQSDKVPKDPFVGTRESAIDAAMGLTSDEAQACYAKSLVMSRRIDALVVAQEKKRVIAGIDGLEWFDPLPGGLDAVGGLDNLKAWLVSRRAAYSPEARAYGLPAPRGALLVGVSGCGKSLTAKAIATAWGVPLLKLDLGAIKSKFVGDSEAKLRRVFSVIETIGRCVVWLDELEKAMAGATDGSADGGVSSDALGAFLNWSQERKGEAFVMATANDVSKLPPELMRKGRFDDVWFVDLPTRFERNDILIASLEAHGRDSERLAIDFFAVADASDTFTGAEVAALVPDAMYLAFADGARDIMTQDLLAAAKSVVPLARTAKDKIDGLRVWAEGKARRATTPETTVAITPRVRAVDLEDI